MRDWWKYLCREGDLEVGVLGEAGTEEGQEEAALKLARHQAGVRSHRGGLGPGHRLHVGDGSRLLDGSRLEGFRWCSVLAVGEAGLPLLGQARRLAEGLQVYLGEWQAVIPG